MARRPAEQAQHAQPARHRSDKTTTSRLSHSGAEPFPEFTCLACGETFHDHGPGGTRVKFCKCCHRMQPDHVRLVSLCMGRVSGLVAHPTGLFDHIVTWPDGSRTWKDALDWHIVGVAVA